MPKEKVYVYFRFNEKENVMVIINNNEKDQTFDLGRFSESIQGITKGKDVISGKELSISSENKMTISGKSSLILELQK